MEDRIRELYQEIEKLYSLSDAEMICIKQMSAVIQMLGYPPRLTVKLLKALTAMWEITLDEMKEEQKEK